MSESSENQSSNPEIQRVLDGLKREYFSHATMLEDEKLENDIKTSMTIVTSKATVWDFKGRDQKEIQELLDRGLLKIKDLYPNQSEREIILLILDETIKQIDADEKTAGKPSGVKNILVANKQIFTEE